jgi:hypothetical protein
MTHLSVEEMIDFVSFEKLTEENIALAKKVNEHICSCKKCFQKVSAFQTVYEEFQRIGTISDTKQCIYQIIDDYNLREQQEQETQQEIQKIVAFLEEYGREAMK